MSPSPTVFAVAKSRNAGCGVITRFWSSSVSRPDTSRTRWITNITSGSPGIVLVEAERDIVLQRPWQHAVAELRDLLAVLQHDRVLADEVDAGDVAVEIDADAGPLQPRRDLLDMRRFARAVIAGDHHPAVLGEALQGLPAWCRGRTGSPDRSAAHARRRPNRPEPSCPSRSRRPRARRSCDQASQEFGSSLRTSVLRPAQPGRQARDCFARRCASAQPRHAALPHRPA